MKKSLLFAAALSLAVVASAQVARTASTGKQTKAVATQQLKDAKIEHRVGTRAVGAVAPRAKKAVPANSAYYLRPKGTMYSNWNHEGRGFVMPFIFTKPFDEVTWRNMSTAQGQPSWGYKLWNNETEQRDSLVSNDYDLTVRYAYEYEDVPALMMGNVGPYELSGYSVNRTTGAIETTAVSGVASVPMAHEVYSQFSDMLSSSHYYGSSNRFGEEMYGWTYYTGAPGPDYNPDLASDDPAQDRSGYWFGKNYGDWNMFGIGFEKPVSPYVLNRVFFWATDVQVTEDVDLECRVYRLGDELPAYNDTAAARIDPAMLNEENLIATGRTTITTDMNEDGSPILEFTLYETDPELGIEYETTPQINDAIVIVIMGYDQPAVQTFSGLITNDEEDEGVGEVTYLGHQEEGVITGLVGLNNFFTSGALKAGPSIFIEATRPFITFNYSFEEGEYTFPEAGGQLAYNIGGQTLTGVEFYATSPKADWTMATVEGGEVPEWLTITLTDDEENGEWTGVVTANVTAAALPANMPGREATVRFAINGAYIDYHFVQGTPVHGKTGDVNGDGNVDVDDMNLVINIMLNKGATMADYPAADVDGSGSVDVDDLNIIINIMLGKA